ncbi:MAG: hypothetical protein C5S38_05765 [Candidatus Methanophagaceae archaeon]|nr:MAG: hypothetical protein C5S38_05765 [Methanophagales archaeon]KAF5435586.1 hypothetical protein C5S36_02775 [Methanophagales archaeon]
MGVECVGVQTVSKTEGRMRCKHESCGTAEKVWLPYEFDGRINGLKPHQYCVHCGVVKNITSDRAKSLGYYVNELAKMQITKVQMRLIIKELEALDFDDAYSMTKSVQKEMFSRVIQKYCSNL